jgi:hypothetical protein
MSDRQLYSLRLAAPSTQETAAPQQLTDDVKPVSMGTINSVLDDTGTVLVTEAVPSIVKQVYPLPDQTPLKMFERLYDIGSFSWSTANPALTPAPLLTVQPFRQVISNTFIEPVLNWFQYFRADIELHFRIQTTQFYQGALMITAAPTVMNTVNPYCTVNPVARSWLGPKYISAQTQDTLVLHLPWLLP